MLRDVAVLKGKTTLYSYLDGGKVLLMKENYKHMTVTHDTFVRLFYRLTENLAALKEDCIDYVVYYPYQPLLAYPKWYIDAHESGEIFEQEFGHSIFYDTTGELLMSPGGIVLKNIQNRLRYMEREEFDKYYEVPGGYDDEC